MKKIILLFGLFLPYILFSQGENNNWYFGNKAGVTFNTNPPEALESPLSTSEATATVSDSNGNLLFYTDGRKIWNREHNIMLNGNGLTGGDTSQQNIILPKPDSSSIYYVFTTPPNDYISTPHYIAYSVVDMSLGAMGTSGPLTGQPLGGVDVANNLKNVEIFKETISGVGSSFDYQSEAITAVLHSDNQSYWVLIPNGIYLYAYLLDDSGFINTPVISPLSPDDTFVFENYGSIKASPILSDDFDYSHLISIALTTYNKWKVYSFDNTTGELTTDYEEEIITPYSIYSTEFNSDGTLLYGVNNPFGHVWVFDISSKNINLIPGSSFYTGTLQRAVNNNIYVSVNSSSVLYHISNPDSFTSSSLNLDEDNPTNINLGVNNAIFGLPQLIPLSYNILPCDEDLVLNTPEIVYNKIYEVSNTITAHQNYNVGLNRDITLSAGNMVEILPNSHIEGGSVFRAMIEGCENVSSRKSMAKNVRPVREIIHLNKKVPTDLKIYPNPSDGLINISNTTVIDSVTITDMNGRVVKNTALESSEGQIDISDLSHGVYILNITSNGETFTKKIIKQ